MYSFYYYNVLTVHYQFASMAEKEDSDEEEVVENSVIKLLELVFTLFLAFAMATLVPHLFYLIL